MNPFQLQGVAKPQQLAVLHFMTEGSVASLGAREGDQVETGQLLIALDDRGPRATARAAAILAEQTAEITIASVAAEQKRKMLERVKIAMQTNASSAYELEIKQAEFDQALAFLESQKELQKRAQAELELAQVQVNQFSLFAPFPGTVLQIHSRVGNSVNPTQPMVTIANLKTLELEMHLPVHLLGKIQSGSEYFFQCSAPVSTDLPATATFVSPVIDPTSQTFRAVFTMQNDEASLPAGFTAKLITDVFTSP